MGALVHGRFRPDRLSPDIRRQIEDQIEFLLDLLDFADPDADLEPDADGEPWLGWPDGRGHHLNPGDDREDDADFEVEEVRA